MQCGAPPSSFPYRLLLPSLFSFTRRRVPMSGRFAQYPTRAIGNNRISVVSLSLLRWVSYSAVPVVSEVQPSRFFRLVIVSKGNLPKGILQAYAIQSAFFMFFPIQPVLVVLGVLTGKDILSSALAKFNRHYFQISIQSLIIPSTLHAIQCRSNIAKSYYFILRATPHSPL